jgi:hypothetical protein
MTGLTRTQYGALVVVDNGAAFLSLLGSLLICRTSWRKRTKLYHRLLFALSASDVLSSAGLVLHPWLMPRGTPNLVWAVGNSSTCQAAGFMFVVFLLLVSFYNCLLSMMFLFTVRYKWKDEDIHKHLETPAHVVAFVIPLFIGVSGIVSGSFKPTIFVNTCWIGSCSIDQLYRDGSCPPDEVTYGWVLGWVSVAMLSINTIVAVVSTILVYRTVQSHIRSIHTHEFDGDVNVQMQRRKKEVANQAVAYTVIYCNSYVAMNNYVV